MRRTVTTSMTPWTTLLEQRDVFRVITAFQPGLPRDLAKACTRQARILDDLCYSLNPWLAQYSAKPVFYCRVLFKLIADGQLGRAHRLLDAAPALTTPQGDWAFLYAIDAAARLRDLGLVRRLHARGLGRCTTAAMDAAAAAGHFEMVVFLGEHRTEGCTQEGLERAWKGQFLEIVKYLEAKYPQLVCRKKRHWQHVVRSWSRKAMTLLTAPPVS
ncbi:hypothetical protein SPRG_15715 [Saprolegnia parasitica CBS 223.65]|uniref:Uncharacterized protein n=1 Tax=Saprolegnia parasitica (strain CBS 223.65) TaxID=695850 RepID=A0A067BLS0_SAPPC|nr:hypothetical protein SPRG_15715 [Saprolegnia parasitica CBS 223.65]KDO19148.1 hypothetical protein SPRG_15715 [Saprolegnia parasitica CBS 223.65]|eukprot:XP_012210146.1 hypothetical protein SPRG_15715 [Saprolegnia parasitica CBS 223.65]